MKEGFICECGTRHEFGFYVAAHWNEVLKHTCKECGAQHSVYKGETKLLKSGKKARSDAADGEATPRTFFSGHRVL